MKVLQMFLYQLFKGIPIMQLQKYAGLINSTLILSFRNWQAVLGAKTNHFVGKMSFSASTETKEKFSKNVIFGQKWHFSPEQ